MVRRTKKTTTFVLIVLAAMLTLGVGYAQWTGQLSATINVNTADFDVQWTAQSTDLTSNPAGVATCEFVSNHDDIVFEINNGHPSVRCDISATMTNLGDVPVDVALSSRTAEGPGIDWDLPFCPGLVNVNDSVVLQPGEDLVCSSSVHVEDGSQPGATYQFMEVYDFSVSQ